MDGDRPLFDSSRLSFDEFVNFFFDHDIGAEEYWYLDPVFASWSDFDDEGVASPRVIVGHMTRLFTDFADVAPRFSLPQVNAGIWAMFTNQPFRLQKHLWLASVPLVERLGCIRSMYFVYSEYVAKSRVQVMENCFSMWWDWLAGNFWEHTHFIDGIAEGDVASLNQEQASLLGAILETLSRILALSDRRTQEYALHGLGHLHHPDGRVIVQQFLDKHRNEMSIDAIRWVEECRDGTVM
jgi:hypothetical protein